MFSRTLVNIQVFAFAMLFQSIAFASPLTFNVDGVISDSSNQPLESAAVTFRVDVQDSTGTCTLYREEFPVSMTGSNGYFSLVIGKQTNMVFGGGTLDKVFSNDGSAITGSSCTYTPSSKTETRKIVVSFNDGGTQQLFSSQDIQSVPYAVEAGQAHRLTTALSGDVSGTQTTTVVDKIKGIPVDMTGATSGKVLKFQSGSFVIADDLVGTGLTSLNGLTATAQTFGAVDTGNTVTAPAWNSATSTHTLKIPMASGTGVTAGLISNTEYATFLNRITSLTGDVTASGTGAVNVTIGTGKVTSANILDGTILANDMDFTGTNAATTGVVLKDASGKFMNLTCATASEVLTWTATGWACQAPAATGITSLNGQTGTTQNLAAAASGSATTLNYTSASNTHTLNIPMASTATVTAGLVSNTDYVSFNNRLPLSGGTMSGAINMNSNNILNAGNIVMVPGGYLTLPNTTAASSTAGQVWYDSGVIKYYDGTSVKTLGISGGGIQSFNGLTGSTQTLAVNTTGTDPAFTSTGSTHTLNIPLAGNAGANAGLISNTDYLFLKSRQANTLGAGQVWVGNASGGAEAVTLSNDISSITSAGAVTVTRTTTGQSSKILGLDGSGVGTMAGLALVNSGTVNIQASTASNNYTLKLPAAAPTGTQVMQVDNLGNLTWIPTPSLSIPALSQGKIWIGNAANGLQAQTMGGDATLDSSGVLSLKNTGTVGTYTRVVTDAQGRVTSGGVLLSADVVSALGFTPVNKAGDVMTGSLGLGNYTTTTEMTLVAAWGASDKGKTWFNTTTNQVKYWDGSAVQALGVSGAGLLSFNGQVGSTQTLSTPGTSGLAPAWSSASNAHTLNIPMASATSVTAGLISNADYAAMMGKQSTTLADGTFWIGSSGNIATSRALSGDLTVTNQGLVTLKSIGTAGAYTKVTTDAQGRVIAGGTFTSSDVTTALGFSPSSAANSFTNGGNAFGAAASLGTTDNTSLSFKTNSNTQMTIDTSGKVGIGTTTPSVALDVGTLTDALRLPNGTDAQRPANGKGYIRFNTTSNVIEYNSGTGWVTVGAALGYTPVNKAGDAMTGTLSMGSNDITSVGNISMAANKYFTLSNNTTAGTTAGQVWYDAGMIKYYDGSTVKTLGVAGAGITALNGLTAAAQTFVVGNAGTDFNLSFAGSTHTFNLPSASSSNRGALTAADWSTFNAKQSTVLASGQVWVGNASGAAEGRALSGDIATVSSVGLVTVDKTTTGVANKILSLDGSGVANVKGLDVQTGTGKVTLQSAGAFTNYVLTLPNTAGSANQVMASDGAGNLSWVTPLSSSTGFVNGGNAFNGNATIGLNDNYNLNFETNNTTRMTLTSSGNLGIGTTTPSSSLDLSAKTDAIVLPKGATASRPSTLVSGMIRYNTTTSAVEYYDGGTWYSFGKDLGYTPVNKAGDAMSGALSMGGFDITSTGNIAMSANKYLTLSTSSTSGTTAGQIWYDATGVIKYYDGSAVKTLGVAGAGITSLNGATTSVQTLPAPTTNGTTLAWATNTGAGSHTLNIPMASSAGATLGMISNTDYVAFNGKLGPALPAGQIWVGNASGFAQPFSLNGDVSSVSNTGLVTVDKTTTGASNKILALDGSGVANTFALGLKGTTSGTMTLMAAATSSNYSLRLPAAAPAANQILLTDGSGGSNWVANPALAYTPLNKAGDTMTGALGMGNNDITNVGSLYTTNLYSNSGTSLYVQAGGLIPSSTAAGASLNLSAQSATGYAGGNIILTPGTGSTKGSVAIGGNPDPNYTLVVGSSSAPTSAYFTGNGATGAAGYFMANNASGTAGQFVNNQSGSYAKFGSGNYAAIFGTIGSAPGYVGIGTSSPTSKLHVSDSLTADPTGTYISSNTALSVSVPSSSSTDFNASASSIDAVSGSSNISSMTSLIAKATNTTGTGISNMFGVNSQVTNSGTGAVSTAIGVYSVVKNGSSNTMTSAYGGQFSAQSTTAGGITNAYGGSFSAINSGTGTVGQATAGNFLVNNTSSGTMSSAIGGLFAVNNSGTITTGYGIYIGNISATTKYSMYANDASAPTYIAGNVGIGVVPSFKLDISATTLTTLRSINTTSTFSAGSFQNTASGTVAILASSNDAIKINGHIASTDTTLPTLGSCGSGGALNGTDTRGVITMGSATTCSITFAKAYTNNPTCIIGPASDPGTAIRYYVSGTTTTTMTITVSTAVGGAKFNYFCVD